jgi:non-homologous end joining protein Ku
MKTNNYLKSLELFLKELNKQVDTYKKTDEYKKICQEYIKEKKKGKNEIQI